MGIEYQFLPIQLSGLNQKTDDKNLMPGETTVLHNMWMEKTKALRPRDGLTAVGAADPNAVAISEFHDAIVRWGTNTFQFLDGTNDPKMTEKWAAGRYEIAAIHGTLARAEFFDYAECLAFGIGSRTIVREVIGGFDEVEVELSFFDVTTKRVFYRTVIATGNNPALRVKLVSHPDAVVAFLPKGGAFTWYKFTGFAGGVPAYTSGVFFADTLENFDASFDACRCGDYAVFAAGVLDNSDPAVNVTLVWSFHVPTGVMSAKLKVDSPAASVIAVGADRSSNTAMVAWNLNGFSFARIACATNTQIGAKLTFANSGTYVLLSVVDDGSARYIIADYRDWAGVNPDGPLVAVYTDGSGAWALGWRLYSCALASRATFDAAGIWFWVSKSGGGLNNGHAVARVKYGTAEANVGSEYAFPSQAQGMEALSALPEAVAVTGGKRFLLPVVGSGGTVESRLVVRYDDPKAQFAYWGDSQLNTVTPNLRVFDGYRNQLAGWPVYPDQPLAIPSTSAGANYSAGTYGVRVLYARRDQNGNVFRSAPSVARSYVIGGAVGGITINLRPYPFFTYSTDFDAWIEIYRTAVNGIIYYLDGIRSLQDESPTTRSDEITYAFATIDLALVSQPLLYAQGGILENIGPSAVRALAVSRDRCWVIAAEDGRTWYSKRRVTAEGPNFSDAFVLDWNGKRDATAVVAMDANVLLMGPDWSALVYGVGPDETGAGTYEPQELSNERGCIDPRAASFCSPGVYFQSQAGIYLWQRDLSEKFIGDRVEDYRSEACIGVLNFPNREHAWFIHDTGTILDADEYHGIWSTHEPKDSTATLLGGAIVGARACLLLGTGLVLRENPASTLDDGAGFTCRLETGWVSLAQVQGAMRVRQIGVLGASQAADFNATLTMKRDFEVATVETFTIDRNTVQPAGSAYQWNVKPKIQRLEAIKLALSFSTATGAGMTISGLAVEVGALPGAFRRAAYTRKAGV